MIEPVFAPTPYTGTDPIPMGAEWLYVRDVLFVVRGQYAHPEKGDTALPPHRWVLSRSATSFVEGTTSVAGISSIVRPDTTGVDDDATWSLVLVPVFDDGGDSSDYSLAGQVFIDVDANRWVRSSDVDIGPDGICRIEPRRLLRIPLWTTKRMAKSGGGFAPAPPSAVDFPATGLLKTRELAQFGTADAPWVMQVDEGWHRAFVQLRFYDFIATKDRALPPGVFLVMESSDDSLGSSARYGASSVAMKDGSIYVLGAGALEKLDSFRYSFATPSVTELDVAKSTYNTVNYGSDPLPLERVATHYWLPLKWVSDETYPWEGPTVPTDTSRHPFRAILGKGADRSKPLCFHLDDVVFAGYGDSVETRAVDRLAVYDSNLAIRHQAKLGGASGPLLPWTDFKPRIDASPMPAERVFFIRGKNADSRTRAIAFNAWLYSVESDRIAEGSYAGLRAARNPVSLAPDTTDMWSTKARVLALPTPWVTTAYAGKSTHLTHLVTFLPLFVDVSNLAATVPAQQKAAKDAVETGLYKAAGRWDQQHPGNVDPASMHGKNYVVVPKGGATDGSTVVKFRHIFTSEVDKSGAPNVIEVWPKGRANSGNVMKLFLVDGPDMDEKSVKNAVTPAELAGLKSPFAFELNSNDKSQDPFDGLWGQWFTLAHELGHWCGLPDDYLENIETKAFLPDNRDRVPNFDNRPKPFFYDKFAMMRGNEHPRLRYFHRRVCNLRELDLDRVKHPPPDVLEYTGRGATLSYPVWTTEDPPSPWTSFPSVPHALGACRLSLFRIGEDESTKTGAFLPVPSAPARVTVAADGILVVACSLWFDLSRVSKGIGERWGILAKFANPFYVDLAAAPHFAIDTPEVAHFKRVAVLFQPRFELSSHETPGMTTAQATLIVSVRETAGAPALTGGSPPTLDVSRDDLGMWIMRYALQEDGSTLPAIDNSPLVTADLKTVVAHLRNIAEKSTLDPTPPARALGIPFAYA